MSICSTEGLHSNQVSLTSLLPLLALQYGMERNPLHYDIMSSLSWYGWTRKKMKMVQTWYLSNILHKHIFLIFIKIWKKTRKSQLTFLVIWYDNLFFLILKPEYYPHFAASFDNLSLVIVGKQEARLLAFPACTYRGGWSHPETGYYNRDQKTKRYIHKLFQKHIQRVNFYLSTGNFTQALLVMLVTNIASLWCWIGDGEEIKTIFYLDDD